MTKQERNDKFGSDKLKYKTPADLEAAIDAYFDTHERPDWGDMVLSLGLSESTIERYIYDEDWIKRGYKEPIKKATTRFSSFWTNYAIEHPNSQTFCIFMLKQCRYGGYLDKQQVDSNNKTTLKIVVGGVEVDK